MKNQKGLTLIELVLTLSIGIMIIGFLSAMYFSAYKGFDGANKAFENQSDIRNAIEITNNSIRFSTVGFAVSEIDYKPQISADNKVTGLVEPWDYLGLSPDKTKLYHYVYVPDTPLTGHYKAETLIDAKPGILYDLKLSKVKSDYSDKLLRYILKVTKDGKVEATISTEVEAINALQVVDWGDANNPAVALAYRTEETPMIDERPSAAVAVVIDTSGSMVWGLDGSGTTISDTNPQRLNLLKNTLTDSNYGLLRLLEDTVSFVSLIPFSTDANIPNSNYSPLWGIDVSKFYNVSEDSETLVDMINALSAVGATNTGDGLRRAYGQLLNFENDKVAYGLKSDQELRKYMIVLIDGVTTVGSADFDYGRVWTGWGYRYRYAEKGFTTSPYVQSNGEFTQTNRLVNSLDSVIETLSFSVGNGAVLDQFGEDYVAEIGQLIQDSKKVDQCFVIGYSNYIEGGVYTELESLADVAKSLGISVGAGEVAEKFVNNDFVFMATDKESLREAFDSIGGLISDDLWQIEGPKLNP
ncbi:vWA domain-containing protein [Fusibacter ferrireducens]|uniref:VWFA domain-containing protein n=1 Tax=Fusibacter ferrireducens TaxID=2785058 RepID=A0ABR9ZTT3_9FIRM|nr:vWA domain-containing protein [Fusibacter ferrireducens]MBF4693848.1 hypothetical protein [Fusibacter ferrireducens]